MSSPTPPGGQRTLQKRKQGSSQKVAASAPKKNTNSNSILKIYSDEATGLRVDPLVVLFLAVGFIFSVVALHVISKVAGKLF
ncbi:BBM_1a_G0015360.mRNA.1.CDS.1 [Saccharomyces cerevisiae]|nr:Sbh1p [Saccharomyces cerevisiae YJM1399]CAI4415155.1 CPI_1c_G0015460.mRNA.1.CDS.1 [Saccharomyces cerevisiae]CAI4428318.1 BBM_1a_G0015360.mRNA.1.CDS.1 [Saccharomyces cerevisiae]CAI4428817.1 ADE_G0015230.mRNA.1.CDS.1 [Saccharomyces cerevisiae]CAI5254634.1 ALI_HP2_G0010920.mRNA.1.CDS.1 [Saccharomyces cerevisiae]